MVMVAVAGSSRRGSSGSARHGSIGGSSDNSSGIGSSGSSSNSSLSFGVSREVVAAATISARSRWHQNDRNAHLHASDPQLVRNLNKEHDHAPPNQPHLVHVVEPLEPEIQLLALEGNQAVHLRAQHAQLSAT